METLVSDDALRPEASLVVLKERQLRATLNEIFALSALDKGIDEFIIMGNVSMRMPCPGKWGRE